MKTVLTGNLVSTHCNGIASTHKGKLLEHSSITLFYLLTIYSAINLAVCNMTERPDLLHRHLSKFVSTLELPLEKG